MHIVYEDEMSKVDFNRFSLSIGITKPDGDDPPWLEFDLEDLKVLALLLRKPMTPDGASAASEHDSLRMLATWAEAAAAWIEAGKVKPKPY